jgi:hypothetical protein
MGRYDPDNFTGLSGLLEPLANLRGQDLLGILELAGSSHEPAMGNGDGNVVVSVAHVELAPTHVRLGDPPSDVLIDRHLGIPVA